MDYRVAVTVMQDLVDKADEVAETGKDAVTVQDKAAGVVMDKAAVEDMPGVQVAERGMPGVKVAEEGMPGVQVAEADMIEAGEENHRMHMEAANLGNYD